MAIYCVVGLFNVVLTFFRAATLLDQGGTAALVGYATGGLAVLFFLVLVGLWTLRSWAWRAGLLVVTLDLLLYAVVFDLLRLLLLLGMWVYRDNRQSASGSFGRRSLP